MPRVFRVLSISSRACRGRKRGPRGPPGKLALSQLLMRIECTIAAGVAAFVPIALMFRGVDKYQASRRVQSGDDGGDQTGGEIDGADKRTAVRGRVGGARGESRLLQLEHLVQAFVSK